MYVTAVLVIVVLTLFIAFYRKRKKDLSVFKELGIPGPTPNLILGNAGELQSLGPAFTWQKWAKQFGNIYGYYEGVTTPVIVTSDLDILHHIFVKDFSNFSARKNFVLGDNKPNENDSMFQAEGYRWKRLRTIVSPVFTTSKLKSMTPLINDCIEKMMTKLDEQHEKDKAFNILEVFQGLTMEVIASTAFGIEVSQLKQDEPFLVACKKMFRNMERKNMPLPLKTLFLTAVSFPEFVKVLRWLFFSPNSRIRRWLSKQGSFLTDQCENIIKDRKQNPVDRPDFIQMMLSAETDSIDLKKESDLYKEQVSADEKAKSNTYIMGGGSSVEKFNKQLTLKEMVANSRLFLMAGFETTSGALGYSAYELAFRPEIQEKLQTEIDEALDEEGKLDYTTVQKMEYLDMVFNETLRFHSIAPSVATRKCLKDTKINGTLIKKGMVIAPDILTIHSDPNIWGPEPDKFDPERFAPELHSKRHPMSFLAFGAGPRNCIGMRFAILEGKLALANLLKKYTIEKCAETDVPIKKTEGVTIAPTDGVVMVKLRLRYKSRD